MNVLVDENIPRTTVGRLRELGHDVRDVRGTEQEGCSDADLWAAAVRERRLLITTDKGFTVYRSISHFGILIARLRQPNRVKIHESVMHAIEHFAEDDWQGLLVVMRDKTMSTARASRFVQE